MGQKLSAAEELSIAKDDRYTSLGVRVKTAKRLLRLKKWGESYDDVLNRLLDQVEKEEEVNR